MSYCSILVHVDNAIAAQARLSVGARLANRFESSLSGVFLQSSLYTRHLQADAVASGPVDQVERLLSQRTEAMRKANFAAHHVFDECVRTNRFPFYWLTVDGDSSAELAACARRHDLAILPPQMKPAFGDRKLSASEIGMASGGPMLVLKHGGYPLDFGRKILVAWNGSRESARAVRDAAPFLATADQVDFLTVSHGASDSLDELMQRHLTEHCCRFGKLIVDRSDASSIADRIRFHVAETNADMVVMGLYGHSRLQELVLGGVSRELLRDPPMPLLVSH
jgi:nucleotide-binding universal stress UspA family protein